MVFRGVPGELVDLGVVKPVEEQQFTSVTSFTAMTLNEVNNLEFKSENKTNEVGIKPEVKIKKPINTMDTITEVADVSLMEENEEIIDKESKDEEELLDEIEADYKIGKVVTIKKVDCSERSDCTSENVSNRKEIIGDKENVCKEITDDNFIASKENISDCKPNVPECKESVSECKGIVADHKETVTDCTENISDCKENISDCKGNNTYHRVNDQKATVSNKETLQQNILSKSHLNANKSVEDVTKKMNKLEINSSKKPSLEEIIAKHREKQKNIKTIKTLDITEILNKSQTAYKTNNQSHKSKLTESIVKPKPIDSKPIESKQVKSKLVESKIELKVTDSNVEESDILDQPHNSKFVEQRSNLTVIDQSLKHISKSCDSSTNSTKDNSSKETSSVSLTKPASSNILDFILNCIKQWFTIETYIYLYGETKIKELLDEKKMGEYFEKLKITELEMSQKLKYMKICKRLQIRELTEEKYDKSVIGQALQPIPDFKRLKEENKAMNLKVKSFYCGLLYEKEQVVKEDENIENNLEEQGPPAVLPLVDASSQNALRRKVFLNSINRM